MSVFCRSFFSFNLFFFLVEAEGCCWPINCQLFSMLLLLLLLLLRTKKSSSGQKRQKPKPFVPTLSHSLLIACKTIQLTFNRKQQRRCTKHFESSSFLWVTRIDFCWDLDEYCHMLGITSRRKEKHWPCMQEKTFTQEDIFFTFIEKYLFRQKQSSFLWMHF